MDSKINSSNDDDDDDDDDAYERNLASLLPGLSRHMAAEILLLSRRGLRRKHHSRQVSSSSSSTASAVNMGAMRATMKALMRRGDETTFLTTRDRARVAFLAQNQWHPAWQQN